ncbi:MAG TPA: glycine cleavage system aminomethyltransferase GcvT [Pseudonocardia sp.]
MTEAGRAEQHSPLEAEHERLGATFTDFAGWRMPVRYTSDLAEHHAVRTAGGVFDLSHMGEIEVTGPAASAALSHALASDINAVTVGRAKYTLLCAPDGGVLDDLVVYRLAEQHFLLVVNAANSAADLAAIRERTAEFDASVLDRSAGIALIAVQGPRAAELLESLEPELGSVIGTGPDRLKYYAARPATVSGVELVLARTGYTGEDGFELYLPAELAVPLWRAILAAGQPLGVLPAGLACRDTLRLEAGMALYGHELDTETNPFAAGLARVVALEHNFVGRDALRARAAEPPARTLAGLVGTGRRAARAGCAVLDPAGTPVGVITSGVLSPTLGVPIALAYLDAGLAEPGTELAVDVRGRTQPVTVTSPPFYRRPRETAPQPAPARPAPARESVS